MSLRKLPSIKTKDMSEEKWLEIRQNSIGGSDCGAILGFNKYESPLSLYSKKIGEIEQDDISDKLPVKFGNYMEDLVAQIFEEETGKKVRNHNYMMYHPEYDFMSANIDKAVIGENAILECKTASEFKKKDWINDNIPPSYMAQCYHYMLVTGVERIYIAVVFGNSTFHWDYVDYDEDVIESIKQKEIEFWNEHVLKGIPPEIDGSEATANALDKMWKETKDDEIVFDDKAKALFKAWNSIKSQIKELQADERKIKNEFKSLMGENEVGKSDSFTATWKQQNRNQLDAKRFMKENPELSKQYMKQTTSRVFKIKEN